MFVISMVCYEFKIGCSIRRSPFVPSAVSSPGPVRFRPAQLGSRRPVARSVQVSPVGFVCISSVRFVPSVPFVACFVRSFRSLPFVRFVHLFAFVRRLSFRSCSARLVRLTLSRLILVQVRLALGSSRSVSLVSRSGFVRFVSFSVELVLCSRLLACRVIYIILAYIIHYMGRKANELFIEKHVFFDNISFQAKLSPPRTFFAATFPLKSPPHPTPAIRHPLPVPTCTKKTPPADHHPS